MANKKVVKTKNKGDKLSMLLNIGFIAFIALLLVTVTFAATYDVVEGKIVTAIPPTPYPTPTPTDFEVIGKVKRIQVVGSDWDGYNTWITLEIISAERMFQKGEVYNLKLPIDANTELDEDQIVQLMCDWAYNKQISCNSEYELVKEQ